MTRNLAELLNLTTVNYVNIQVMISKILRSIIRENTKKMLNTIVISVSTGPTIRRL